VLPGTPRDNMLMMARVGAAVAWRCAAGPGGGAARSRLQRLGRRCGGSRTAGIAGTHPVVTCQHRQGACRGGNGQSGAVHVVAGHDEAAAGGGGGHMASRVGAADRDSWPLQRPGVWLCGYICPGLAGGRSVAATGG
jgi:hypothetical protein